MGQNFILNMATHDVTVVAYNRTATKVQEFLDGPPKANLFSVPLPLQRCSPS
jgi:6-phosphogluconate dehydrogenase